MISWKRSRIFGLALVAAIGTCAAVAPASVEMNTGIRYVIPTGTTADCSAKAQTALNAYLQNATESPSGSGDWLAYGPQNVVGPNTAAATVRCSPLTSGYVATFTCVVDQPLNPYSAGALCLDIAHNFSGKPVTPLPTAQPAPTGCSTANLVGTWVSNDKSGPTIVMDVNGGITDNEGVSGNWIMYGSDVTLTYYGNHSLKLSPDGKHLRGGGYDLTRKC